MRLAKVTIENFRCFGEGTQRFDLPFRRGLTALVGENEAGKTAVIDALRFALGTTDQEWYHLEIPISAKQIQTAKSESSASLKT